MEDKKEKILKLIKEQELAVLSTVDASGMPEAAVVGISEDEELNLYFGTFNTYRKYKNLKNNPNVALVIGWEAATVQYEGVAEELDGVEREKAEKIHLKKLPGTERFVKLPEERFFRVRPRWIRYMDYSEDELYGKSFEIEFDE